MRVAFTPIEDHVPAVIDSAVTCRPIGVSAQSPIERAGIPQEI